MAQASWTKLRDGSWGIKGAGLTAGSTQRVAKRNGEVSLVTVDRVLWTDGTVAIATVHAGLRDAQCEECGHGPARYTRRDSSGIVGQVCGRCARLSSYELSFA
jgi:hypothetical protein